MLCTEPSSDPVTNSFVCRYPLTCTKCGQTTAIAGKRELAYLGSSMGEAESAR